MWGRKMKKIIRFVIVIITLPISILWFLVGFLTAGIYHFVEYSFELDNRFGKEIFNNVIRDSKFWYFNK
jgi:hypothetical protein